MKHKIVAVKNVARLQDAGNLLINRAYGMPGMGLIWGPTGFGKTTAATWFINQCRGVYVRAMRLWTPSAMLRSITLELNLAPAHSCATMVEAIVERLAETGRPLFIDEADYVVERGALIDTLRDLHDLSTVPVIMIGMAGIQRTITRRKQLSGRIAQWVEFGAADMQDASLIAQQCCDVQVATDLLTQLHHKSAGSVRLIVVGLSQIELYAHSIGIKRMSAENWPAGRDFFLGEAPAKVKAQVLNFGGR